MSERTEIGQVEDFRFDLPEPTNYCQFIGTLRKDAQVQVFERSGDRVVKGMIAVQRNSANGADFIFIDDFEEDWYGGTRQSALENAKAGALVLVSGELRKNSSGTGDNRRWFTSVRAKAVKVYSDQNALMEAQRAALQQIVAGE